jgi:UDP-N-acetylmuramoylalanine--D-glutamate ligase
VGGVKSGDPVLDSVLIIGIDRSSIAKIPMKKALVVGLGLSGVSAAEFLLHHGWQVAATDNNISKVLMNPEVQLLLQRGVPLLRQDEHFSIDSFQLAIVSPGIALDESIVKRIREANIECIGEAELAFRFMKQPAAGITGTNGKTTVTLLLEHILTFAGLPAQALGNVGLPLAKHLPRLSQGAIVCAELSSYQLETMRKNSLACGVILNITPDHLDRYKGMKEYASAKARMGSLIKPEGKLFVEEVCYQQYRDLLPTEKVERYGYDLALDCATDLKYLYRHQQKLGELPDILQGKKSHDLENFMAAYLLADFFEVPYETIRRAYDSFEKPHHRIEFVRDVDGVRFYDDSKGTNIGAVTRAVEAMQGPTILIAGGVHKGSSYTPWIASFLGKVKKIFAIGEAAPIIHRELNALIPVKLCSTLKDAVEESYKEAERGDNVLLSPGCSSFDMFRDYAHRGDEFVRIVKGVSK